MAYTTINKHTDYFNNKLWTGNGSTQNITGVDHTPDFVWIKKRTDADGARIFDTIRGATKAIFTNSTAAETTVASELSAFGSDGYTLGASDAVNGNTKQYVGWNWSAGGTSPSQTYVVKVVSDSGNKYRFDDFGTSAVTLDLQEGGTYTFDQADSSNSGHPLRFYTAADKSGGEYTTGVTTNGTPGSSGAYTRITVAASAPTLYYQCSSHAGMGGQANTNSTHGSSNFSGSIQSIVSANTTAGFSIVRYTGNNNNAQTVGHGLGVAPKMMIIKRLGTGVSGTANWVVYHKSIGASVHLHLNTTDAQATDNGMFNSTDPTSSVFTIHAGDDVNKNNDQFIAYCFAEKTGFSKIGSYTGNGSSDGTFVYTGFKPTLVLTKGNSAGENWFIHDGARNPSNPTNKYLRPNLSDAEGSYDHLDLLSNGFKSISAGSTNGNNVEQIYMAFGQSLVGSNNVPATAR